MKFEGVGENRPLFVDLLRIYLNPDAVTSKGEGFMGNYAGFWIRVAAYLIDFVILMVVALVVSFGTGVSLFDQAAQTDFGIADLVNFVVGIAYFVAFESSTMQGTPGKRALGLIVTDLDGGRISPMRAVGRYFAKILSTIILFIGFIMIGFTERKQGLHDMIAGTLVQKANPGEGMVDARVFD